MILYVLRRILYMVPTVLGVILITFALFNIAGGDTAMLKLGKQARPKALEEYDVQRGYNKPLFAGYWGRTRAYQADLSLNAGPWASVEGSVYTNPAPHAAQTERGKWGRLTRLLSGRPFKYLALTGDRGYQVPMSFSLSTNDVLKWTVCYRLPAGAASFEFADGSNVVKTCPLGVSRGWRTEVVDVPAALASSQFRFRVDGGTLDVRDLRLARATSGVFDSQFVMFMGQIVRFDFGESAETNQKVSRMILDGIMPSIALALPIFLLGMIVEIILALVCAFYRNTFIDRFFVVISVVMMSVSYLVWIVGGQYLFAYRLGLFPIWGFESARYLALPCFIGVVSGLGGGVRFYRTIMLDEMYRDYVRTAFAKGVGKAGVLFKHVLKNAMIPILTSSVMALAHLYNGNLLLETFFGIPGLGNLSITALNNADFDVLRVVVLIGAVIYVIANLLTDICYTLVDPRVRLK